MVYVDNASTSWPKPESVYLAMDEFLRRNAGNPGRSSHSMALAAAEIVEETRALLAQLFNIPTPERIIFTLNCTDAINIALKGLLKPGDEVLTDSIGHNSLVRPLRKLERHGVVVKRVPPMTGDGVLSPKDIAVAITGRTRLLVVTHGSNVNGVVQPIEKYGEVARQHDIIFMVDAAQTAGRYSIDVQASYIDLLAFPGHKGLFGPPGTGGLYISERVDLDTLREGGTGTFSEIEEQPGVFPDKYESGTLNTVGICGLGAGLKFIFEQGLEQIKAKEERLTNRLLQGLSQISRVSIYRAGNGAEQAAVISFNIEGYEPTEIGIILDQAFDIKVRTGLHCAPSVHRLIGTFPHGTVRLSPGYFNTEEEMDMVINAIEKIASSKL
jgi:cysteine desulfurase family protein